MQQVDEATVWEAWWMRIFRWLVFLPIGLVAGGLLQGLLPAVWQWMDFDRPFQVTIWTFLLGATIIGFLFSLLYLWGVLVYLASNFSCAVVAPTPKVAAVILATLFVLSELIFVAQLVFTHRWGLVLYNVLFSAIFLGGAVSAYRSDT